MSKAKTTTHSSKSKRRPSSSSPPKGESITAAGGELHQIAGGEHLPLTTNQGLALSDNQNSLKSNSRGPALLEDFVLREKTTHFDHERIPGRNLSLTADAHWEPFAHRCALVSLVRYWMTAQHSR